MGGGAGGNFSGTEGARAAGKTNSESGTGNGGIEKVSNNTLLNAGKKKDKGGELTKAGRALQKHGSRPGSIYPQTAGNAAKINALGNYTLESILNNPNAVSAVRHHARYEDVLEIRVLGGMGARFSADGNTFIGFLD